MLGLQLSPLCKYIYGNTMKIFKFLQHLAAVSSLLLSSSLLASGLDNSLATTIKTHQNNKHNQQQIDKLDEQSQVAMLSYQQNQQQADLLEAYNKQLALMVNSQQQELADLALQLDSLAATEQAALPLLVDMLQALSQFIEHDLPFLAKERARRINRLHANLQRADVSLAEKYRQVLEAYQIEIEYGRTIEAYQAQLPAAQLPFVETSNAGESLQLNFFRLGRSALYCQTLDTKYSALWDAQAQRWQALDASYNQSLRSAMQVAWQQAIPQLLTLPVNPAVEAQ
ncbi:DUF3450 domain-containing protein [Agarivorans gilvus]|uniref:DUF3450 domain-containing protein n=2 Tax=Agarivorans gilvus TaxID=680279 RepID=A0ABQ1I5Y5_9ALTE|nr:DUF3450 domain-containing protein [Agarivorans gilvus]